MTKFQRLWNALKLAFVEDKCQPQWDLNYLRNLQIDNIKQRTIGFWLKGGTPDMRQKARQSDVKESSTEWLDIIWKGKMVEINGKGKIRAKKTRS